ncbi:hypothetical protein NYE76_11380 [Paenibacillus sp. FSL M7-0831]
MKSAHQSVIAGGLPIYELRNQLEAAIGHIKEYNPLTFVPRTMNEYDYIFHNSILCALSSYLLAKWSGLQQKDWMQAAFMAFSTDIGNAKIDPAILYKPDPLTVAEAEEMRRHTAYGLPNPKKRQSHQRRRRQACGASASRKNRWNGVSASA